MAGTGHSYEIVNIAEVRQLIDECAAMADDSVAATWFRTKGFLRYVTSDKFVFKIRRNASMSFLEAVDEAEREFIERKHEAGGDIRLFSLDQFRRGGPDIRHTVDWMDMLRHRSPSEHAKLTRMSPEDVFRKVKVWIPAKGRGTKLPEGKIRHILTTQDDYSWFELEDDAALLAEGDAMSHCVDGYDYAQALKQGQSRILSMRSAEGARHLTVEIRPRSDSWRIRQIQAFGNAPAPEASIDSICEILNHLKIVPNPDGREERRARVTFTKDGWQSIYRAWQRVEILDMECVTDGYEIIVMSPIHPDRPLLSMTKEFASYSAHLADTRHYSIDELRAAAVAVNEYGARISDKRFACDEAGRVAPYFDTLVEEEQDGHTFLRDTENRNIYVTALKDKALLLLEVGRHSRFLPKTDTYSSTPAWVFNARHWKENDAFRCCAALTAAGANFMFGASDDDLTLIRKQFDLVQGGDNAWHPFKLEATRHDSKNPDSHWMETDYRLCWLYKGNQYATFNIDGKELLGFPYTWPTLSVSCKDIAKRFNKLRLVPSADLSRARIGNRLAMKRTDSENLVCIGGKWKNVRSQRDLVQLVKCPETLTAGEATIVLQALPDKHEERLPETDQLYATSVAIWLSHKMTHVLGLPYRDDLKTMVWLFERLDLITSRKLKTTMIKLASTMLGRWSKGSKMPFLSSEDAYIRIFFGVWRNLSSTLINRVVCYVFRNCAYWLGRDGRDIIWLREVYPSLTNAKAKAAMYRGIEHGASAYTSDTPDILLVNAECLAFCAMHQRVLIDYKLDLLKKAHDSISAAGYPPEKQPLMVSVQKIIDEIPQVIARTKVEAERRHAEWMQKFRKTSDLSEHTVAA
jgi:hypothetical protein